MLLLSVKITALANTENPQTYNLLFVGNSLTYTNNLPALVKQVALARGINVTTKMLAKPNYAIVDHWADGRVQELIKTKNYDYVIIQQGPSSQPDGYNMLVNGGRFYRDLTQEHGAKLAYFMVWPARQYYHTFDGVIANYTAGAQANDAILLPVGQIWKNHFDQTGDFSYYSSDQFHPSKIGSEVAATIIVETLFQGQNQNLRQAWITGTGEITDNQINIPSAYITTGGMFGEALNTDEINPVAWGHLNIEFTSCHTATMNYQSLTAVNGNGFGAGSYTIHRLANNHVSQQCEVSGFTQTNNKAFFSGSFYGGSARDGEGFTIDYLNASQAIVTWYTYLPTD